MMTYFLFCVRDRAANVYGRPFTDISVESAKRAFGDELNDPSPHNVMNRHPEDFDLYVLGTYEDDGGRMECGVPRQVAIGKDLVRSRPDQAQGN